MNKLKSFDEFLNSSAIEFTVKSLVGQNAVQVLKLIRDKWNDTKIDPESRIFILSKKEQDELHRWFEEVKTYTGTIGVGPTIKFTSTSIGEIIEAEFGDKQITLRNID